jgi:predicted transcriptional regulator
VCLEDCKKFQSLKRHLCTQYDMTPEKYREKWGLQVAYPVIAPNDGPARITTPTLLVHLERRSILMNPLLDQ